MKTFTKQQLINLKNGIIDPELKLKLIKEKEEKPKNNEETAP